MAPQPEIKDEAAIGDWLQQELACYMETSTWATERAARVDARLQDGRPEADRLETRVLWTAWATAFTAPGRFVYFSRPLLERCPHDEAAAFVIAHEIAHHDLGHTRLFPAWLNGLRRVSGVKPPEILAAFSRN